MDLVITIKKKNLREVVLLELMIIYIMFARYFEIRSYGNLAFALVFALIYTLNYNRIKDFNQKNTNLYLTLFSLIMIIIFNVVLISQNRYLKANFNTAFYPICFAVFIFYAATYAREEFYSLLEKNCLLLNIFWVANIIICLIQLTGNGFLIKSEWLSINSFYEDQCCGLFGNSGTHELAFFSIFIVIYNFVYAKKLSFLGKRVFVIYNLVTAALIMYISTQNDNTMLLMFLPIAVLAYLLFDAQWSESRISGRLYSFLKIVLIVMIAAAVLKSIPAVNDIIKDTILDKTDKVLNADVSDAEGGNERLAIFQRALSREYGWFLGRGLGYCLWAQEGAFGFKHFGLSSIGCYTMLGGIWYYIIHCILCGIIAARGLYREHCPLIFRIIVLGSMVIFSIYSNIFTSEVSLIWILLLFCVLGRDRERALSQE